MNTGYFIMQAFHFFLMSCTVLACVLLMMSGLCKDAFANF